MGDDNDPNDLGGLLFGCLVYREIRDGRLDAAGILRTGCLIVLLVGAVIGGGLLLAGAFATPQYGGGYVAVETAAPYPTQLPAIHACLPAYDSCDQPAVVRLIQFAAGPG
jgi:hypothetical protein